MNRTSPNETDTSEILARLNKEQILILIPSTILVIITMLVGVIGNSLTCYVYGFRVKMTPTNYFVVTLAIVDFITCLLVAPVEIVRNIYPLMTIWDTMCKFQMMMGIFTGLCTCGLLIAIAVDRYRNMCCPLMKQISMKIAKIITLCIFLFSAIQGGIANLYYGSVEKSTRYPNVTGHECSVKLNKNDHQSGFFAFYFFVIVSTVIILVVCYSIVLRTMKKIVKKNTDGGLALRDMEEQKVQTQKLKRTEESMKRLNRTTVTMIMISAVFIITYFPTLLMLSMTEIDDQKLETVPAIFYWLARNTFFLGSCLNPIIYGNRNRMFKREVQQLFESSVTNDISISLNSR